MPNATICVYLTDDEYIKYLKNKPSINKKIKELIKKKINGGKNEK